VGLCNFFRIHIKDFVLITAPLFRLTRKDSGNKSGPLPDQALQAFYALQKQLTSEPVMAFPKANRQYGLITDMATGTADTPAEPIPPEKNYSHFLLEAAAAVFFTENLRGKH